MIVILRAISQGETFQVVDWLWVFLLRATYFGHGDRCKRTVSVASWFLILLRMYRVKLALSILRFHLFELFCFLSKKLHTILFEIDISYIRSKDPFLRLRRHRYTRYSSLATFPQPQPPKGWFPSIRLMSLVVIQQNNSEQF